MLVALSLFAFADDPPRKLDFDTTAAVPSAGKTFDQGPAHVEFGDGLFVPIRAGNTPGVAFSGSATITAAFADRGDAQHLANQQVLRLGQPAADWAGVAHGGPLTLKVTRAIILADPARIADLLAGTSTVASGFPTDAVQRRFELLDDVANIEFETRNGPDASQFLVADFLGDRPLGYVRPIPSGNTEEDRYLTVIHDPSALEFGDDLAAIGHTADNDPFVATVALGPWTEPKSYGSDAHLVWGGIEPGKVTAEIVARPVGAGFDIDATGSATWEFRAVQDLRTIRIENPNTGGKPKDWVITKLQVNGHDVPVPAGANDGFDLSVMLAKNDAATIHMEWTDRWPFSATTSQGRSIWPVFMLPSVATNSWRFDLKFGTYAADKMASACSGLTTSESTADGIVWVNSSSDTASPPRCSIGAWGTYAEGPRDEFPGVRVALFADQTASLPSIPPFARTVIAFYEGVLPPLPAPELEILEVPTNYGGYTWTSTLGLVTLQQMQAYGEAEMRSAWPHLEEGTMSHEIAHQWWGALVDNARAEDGWMIESLAETYSCVFLAAAFGPKTCSVREEAWADLIEAKTTPRASWSLTRARSEGWSQRVYDYGPYILNRSLRGRIGDQAFFMALDAWARDRTNTPATVAGLQAAFEATSGQDLSAFFDQWVDDGFIPALTGEWSAKSVTVRSDIPFGTIEVPVVVTHGETSETLWVSVVDGVGTVTFTTEATKVVLDPGRLVPARTRKLAATK